MIRFYRKVFPDYYHMLLFIQKILYSLTPSFRTALCNKEFRTAFEAFLFFRDPVNRIQ